MLDAAAASALGRALRGPAVVIVKHTNLRLAPGDDAVAATHTLISFLRDAAPWGVEVSIEGGSFDAGQGYMVDTSAPPLLAAREALREAYG